MVITSKLFLFNGLLKSIYINKHIKLLELLLKYELKILFNIENQKLEC